jgi:hypothetical protein
MTLKKQTISNLNLDDVRAGARAVTRQNETMFSYLNCLWGNEVSAMVHNYWVTLVRGCPSRPGVK